MKNQSRFATQLLKGKPQSVVIFGTSLSYHLAPILRSALHARFGSIASAVNSGMAGRASRTALVELDEKVIKHKPDTLLMEWAINDAHDYHHEPGALDQGISPAESRDNLDTLVTRVLAVLPSTEIILWT
ncbi:MAG: SGNH/GDSL hydrolase family protein, partial [Alphaproteobacteria bacterium]